MCSMPDLKPGVYVAQSADHSQMQLKLKGAVLSAYYPMLNILKKIGAGCLGLGSQISRYFQP